MQILSSQFVGKPIISVQTSEIIGYIKDMVTKQEDLKIVALCVSQPHQKESYYLLPSDIRFFNKDKVIVDSFQKLSEFSELVRYQHDITSNYRIIKKRVKTSSGKKLGRVVDYMFDPAHYFVTKLNVKPLLLQNIVYTKLLIDRDDIIDTQKNYIIVKDNFAKLKKPATAVLPAQS